MIYTSLESLRGHTETDEVGSDEPYVIVNRPADILGSISGINVPFPASRVFRYGPSSDVDQQETRQVASSRWGFNARRAHNTWAVAARMTGRGGGG